MKRVVGEEVVVETDCFADGHDAIRCLLHVERSAGTCTTREIEMDPLGNDRWRAVFRVERIGEYRIHVSAWVDPFTTWRRDLRRRFEAGQDASLHLATGAALVERAAAQAAGANLAEQAPAERSAANRLRGAEDAVREEISTTEEHTRASAESPGTVASAERPSDHARRRNPAEIADSARHREEADRRALASWARRLRTGGSKARRVEAALHPELAALMTHWGERPHRVRSTLQQRILVERPRARYSTWYEMFPRSASPDPARPGTLRDVEARLPYVAGMGFDVLYLPPIHPIGAAHRKGRNGALIARPHDPGSPWAIGSSAGGHTSIDPALGTLEDFDHLVAAARRHGVEIALDLAFQCSPDHPWVREHPQWFRHRADGSIQHAENPPKKYEDIVPFDFETGDWTSLWQALYGVVEFWIARGVCIFRVDNPHTKPFAFWEWLIAQIRSREPDVLFLAEAFTRPKVMLRLAKLGFSQSYTYFAWRNEPTALRAYFEELTSAPVVEFFRPNAWPNTPDILTEYLQHGGRPASVIRLILAGTLAASYGIYGPPFELFESTPRHAGSEEYLDSEKYQQRVWDVEHADSLRPLITRLNRIRRDNPALQQDRTLRFYAVDNPALIAYSKTADARPVGGASAERGAGAPSADDRAGPAAQAAGTNVIVCVVNTNPYATESGTVHLDLEALGIGDEPYQLHDLLSGARYFRRGANLAVVLDPGVMPAHVLRVRRRVRSEHDFEYYL